MTDTTRLAERITAALTAAFAAGQASAAAIYDQPGAWLTPEERAAHQARRQAERDAALAAHQATLMPLWNAVYGEPEPTIEPAPVRVEFEVVPDGDDRVWVYGADDDTASSAVDVPEGWTIVEVIPRPDIIGHPHEVLLARD